MKTTHNIKNMLGLTQEEMAILLGVSRSQWSMYELGKRDLPIAATQKLAHILQHIAPIQNRSVAKKSSEDSKKQRQLWKEELAQIDYEKHKLEHKLAKLYKKQQENEAALQVVTFLKTQTLPEVQQSLVRQIEKRCTKLPTPHLERLLQLWENKLEILQWRQGYIKQKLKS